MLEACEVIWPTVVSIVSKEKSHLVTTELRSFFFKFTKINAEKFKIHRKI